MAEKDEGSEGVGVLENGLAGSTETGTRGKPGSPGRHPWDATEREVFASDLVVSREWLETFPESPDLAGKRVVEIGCGYGALSVVSAEKGAQSVLGVEADANRAGAARRVVSSEYPDLIDRIEFVDYPALVDPGYDGKFDVVLSQNSFEHYEDPDEVFDRMIALLNPGGLMYAGFGPLWRSPFGSHLKEVSSIPWAHLWGGDYLFRAHNRARPHDPRTDWSGFGLNRASYRRYREMFNDRSDCEVIHFLGNRSIWKNHRLAYFLIEPFRFFPIMREYLTVSIYVVVRKPVETMVGGNTMD